MPKPGKSLTMMAHSRYGMMHPYMLDGKTDIRGYPSSAYCISKYNVPLLDEVVNEAQLRELANWIREHMDIYIQKRCAGGALARTRAAVCRACSARTL